MKNNIGKYIKLPFSIQIKKAKPRKAPSSATSGYKSEGITPTRDSAEPGHGFASGKYETVEPGFALEWLPILENLAVYNADFSYAVDNIVQLGNTDFDIQFSDDATQRQQKEITKLINANSDSWYPNSAGLRSLRADMFLQAAINGAVSIEIVPTTDLKNVVVHKVPVKEIRFLYNNTTDTYDPFQQAQSMGITTTASVNGMIPLNPLKYKYKAWRRIHAGPYPVPPFLAAVRGIEIQTDIVDNIKYIIKKLGMLGFLSVEVAPIDQEPDETDQQYFERSLKFLEEKVYPQVEKNLSNGVVVGWKGSSEFKMNPTTADVGGAEKLVKMVELMLFAGFKQDPNMLGRNFSTTETFGRVILKKMMSQVAEYQSIIDAAVLDVLRLFIMLNGYDKSLITKVCSQSGMATDKLLDEQIMASRIGNTMAMRDNGIIDQQKAANKLGEEEPAIPDFVEKKAEGEKAKAETDTKDKETQENINIISDSLSADCTQFDYNTMECDGVPSMLQANVDFEDRKANAFVNKYSSDVMGAYKSLTKKAQGSTLQAVQKHTQEDPVEAIQSSVYLALLKDWEQYFTPKLDSISEEHVDNIYTYYRKDKKVFGSEAGFAKRSFADVDIPDPVFGLDDYRSIEYMSESDSMYMGKFVTDQDTKKRIYKFIDKHYINGDLPFGNDPKAIKKYKKAFGELLQLETYKLRRIIDTSITNIRNDANLRYIAQAGFTTYEVVEISDKRTCEYCKHMNGRTFDVQQGLSKIDKKVSANPQSVGDFAPFATTLKIDEFKKLDTEELQLAGFSTPSYHCSCRGRIVAKD